MKSTPATPLESDFRTPISLILRLGQGKRDDWETFYEIYSPVIYNLCRARRLQHHDAMDIVSVVMKNFHHAILNGFTLDHSKGRFRGYLARSVERAIREFKRRKRDASNGSVRVDRESATNGRPEADLAALERVERLRHCIHRLREAPDVRRRDVEAFERYALQGEKAAAVSKSLGISVGRLYGIRSEMLDRIRTMMAKLEAEWGEV